jgi:hypothetical protein
LSISYAKDPSEPESVWKTIVAQLSDKNFSASIQALSSRADTVKDFVDWAKGDKEYPYRKEFDVDIAEVEDAIPLGVTISLRRNTKLPVFPRPLPGLRMDAEPCRVRETTLFPSTELENLRSLNDLFNGRLALSHGGGIGCSPLWYVPHVAFSVQDSQISHLAIRPLSKVRYSVNQSPEIDVTEHSERFMATLESVLENHLGHFSIDETSQLLDCKRSLAGEGILKQLITPLFSTNTLNVDGLNDAFASVRQASLSSTRAFGELDEILQLAVDRTGRNLAKRDFVISADFESNTSTIESPITVPGVQCRLRQGSTVLSIPVKLPSKREKTDEKKLKLHINAIEFPDAKVGEPRWLTFINPVAVGGEPTTHLYSVLRRVPIAPKIIEHRGVDENASTVEDAFTDWFYELDFQLELVNGKIPDQDAVYIDIETQIEANKLTNENDPLRILAESLASFLANYEDGKWVAEIGKNEIREGFVAATSGICEKLKKSINPTAKTAMAKVQRFKLEIASNKPESLFSLPKSTITTYFGNSDYGGFVTLKPPRNPTSPDTPQPTYDSARKHATVLQTIEGQPPLRFRMTQSDSHLKGLNVLNVRNARSSIKIIRNREIEDNINEAFVFEASASIPFNVDHCVTHDYLEGKSESLVDFLRKLRNADHTSSLFATLEIGLGISPKSFHGTSSMPGWLKRLGARPLVRFDGRLSELETSVKNFKIPDSLLHDQTYEGLVVTLRLYDDSLETPRQIVRLHRLWFSNLQ